MKVEAARPEAGSGDLATTTGAGSGELIAQLAAWRDLVDVQLAAIWRDPPGELTGLAEAIEYSLLAPGKRIRPLLVIAAAEACGVGPAEAAPVAAAFELMHTYSLVHDDLPCMDDDDLRRGIPASHRRFGEGVAVLVGDALQTETFALVSRAAGASGEQRLAIVTLLANAAGWRGMAGGQHLDLRGSGHADGSALRRLHDLKTGALISASVEAGAVLGGVDDSGRARFAAFGHELGWLFQLVDDLLDEVGDSGRTGKAAGSDLRHGKVTATSVFGGVAGARAAAEEQLDCCLHACEALPDGGGELPAIARYVRNRDH